MHAENKTMNQEPTSPALHAETCSAWISVDDKLPPIGADVLTWGKSMHKKCPDVQRVYNDGNRNPIFQNGWNKGETFEVTHWAKIFPPNAGSDAPGATETK